MKSAESSFHFGAAKLLLQPGFGTRYNDAYHGQVEERKVEIVDITGTGLYVSRAQSGTILRLNSRLPCILLPAGSRSLFVRADVELPSMEPLRRRGSSFEVMYPKSSQTNRDIDEVYDDLEARRGVVCVQSSYHAISFPLLYRAASVAGRPDLGEMKLVISLEDELLKIRKIIREIPEALDELALPAYNAVTGKVLSESAAAELEPYLEPEGFHPLLDLSLPP